MLEKEFFIYLENAISLVWRRPEMSGSLTAEKFDKIVIREGGRKLTTAEKRKYARFLKK